MRAHDYLALLVESEGEDRYLAVEVAADRLRQFRNGALDLRTLLTESAEDGWYLTTTADLDQPLTIERQQTPVEESGFLPADGFVLHESDSPVERKQETGEVPTRPPKLADSAEARAEITRALRLDLVGPGSDAYLADEQLPGWVRPSNWYLTGFLVPRHAGFEQRADADSDDEMEPEVCEDIGAGDDSSEDRRAAKAGFFPSSMGLSFLGAPGTDRVTVVVRWGDYRKVEGKVSAEEGSELPDRWQRTPCEATLSIVLPEDDSPPHLPVPNSRGLEVPRRGPDDGRPPLRREDRSGHALRLHISGQRPSTGRGRPAGRGICLSSTDRSADRCSLRRAARPSPCIGRQLG